MGRLNYRNNELTTPNHRFESGTLPRASLQRLRMFASGKPAVTRRSTES